MIHRLRDIRLIPIVLIAIIALFALKAFGLIFDGGYTLTESTLRQVGNHVADPEVTGTVAAQRSAEAPKAQPQQRPQQRTQQRTQQSWAQQMFNFPDITGAVVESKAAPPEPEGNRPAPQAAAPPPATTPATAPTPPERPVSPAERAILERLSERRGELESRARDLDMRESLLKAAEKQ